MKALKAFTFALNSFNSLTAEHLEVLLHTWQPGQAWSEATLQDNGWYPLVFLKFTWH